MWPDYVDFDRFLMERRIVAKHERRKALLWSGGSVLAALGISAFSRQGVLLGIFSTFAIATGAQMILSAIGVKSELLGTIMATDTLDVQAQQRMEFKRSIGARVAVALGVLKYYEPLEREGQATVSSRLSEVTDIIIQYSPNESDDEFDELYLALLEKLSALQARDVDRQAAITVLQELQSRLGFPTLEYDSRITHNGYPTGDATLADLKILVIDDDPSIRRLVSHYLTGSGAEVLLAESSHDAITAALHERPDIVLADLVLGDAAEPSGHDFIRQLRSAGLSTPVIALTGHGASRAELLREGFATLIPKPFTQEELFKTLLTLPPVARLRVRNNEVSKLSIRRPLQE